MAKPSTAPPAEHEPGGDSGGGVEWRIIADAQAVDDAGRPQRERRRGSGQQLRRAAQGQAQRCGGSAKEDQPKGEGESRQRLRLGQAQPLRPAPHQGTADLLSLA
jgi:hypothetical protein